MAEPLAVLIVEDSESDAQLLVRLLKKAGYKVAYKQVDTSEGMCEALDNKSWDIVISDYSLPQFDGPAALKLLKDKGLDIPFIVVSGTIGEEIAVAMMKSGAHDYLVKGDLARLVPAVERELEQARVRRENKRREDEIQAADKRFRALIENNADAITLLDAQGRVLYDSPSAPGLLGYGATDWIGKDVFQLLHPDDQQKSRGMLRDILENPGVRVDGNFRLRKKDGSWSWIEATAKNLIDEPSVNAIVMNYRDITPRMEAEEALKKSESDFRRLFDNANDVIVIIQPEDEIILEANAAACAAYGFDHDELVGMSLKKLTKHVQKGETHIQEMLAGRPQSNFESVQFNKNGEELQFLINCSLIEYRGKKAILSINRDITERKQAEETVALSEARYRSLVETQVEVVSRSDLSGNLSFVNDSYCRVFGVKREQILGQNFEPTIFQEDLPLIRAAQEAIKHPPYRKYIEIRNLTSDGIRWFGWETSAVYDELGKVVELQGVGRDITERKQAEQALRESESIFRGFLEQSVDAIMLTDEQGIVIQWSRGAEILTGFSRDESIGKPLWDVQFRSALDEHKSTKQYEFMKSSLQTVLLTGQGPILDHFLETPIQRPDGTKLISQTLAFSIKTHKGYLLGSILRDITERKQAEESIRFSEERFRSLYENNTLGLYRTTPDGRILLANPALVKMLGFASADELKARNLEQAGYEPSYSRAQFLETIEAQGQVYGLESSWVRKDRSPIFIRESARAVRDPDGKTLYYDGTVEDITERKRAEELLHESEQRFKVMFEQAPLAINITRGTDIIYANPVYISMFGYSSLDEIQKIPPLELFSPEWRPVIQNNIQQRAQGHTVPNGYEAECIRKDGTRFSVLMNFSRIMFSDGLATVGFIIDISESKRAEEAVHASEARYKGLFEDSPIALWEEDFSLVKQRLDALKQEGITDFNDYFTTHPEAVAECATLVQVLDVNKTTIKMLGARKKEDLFKGLGNLLKDEPNNGFQNELFNITKGKTSFGWEGTNKTLDGRLIQVQLNWSTAPGYENSLSKVIVSMIDITERKQAEEAVRASEDRYKGLFEDSPVALWEEDFSLVKGRLNALKEEGVTDFNEYFTSHPEVAVECVALIKVLDVNKKTMSLFGAKQKDDILKNLTEIFAGEPIQIFMDELVNIAQGRTRFAWEGMNNTLDGRRINLELIWSVAPGFENSLSRVILSMVDITERKKAEVALARSEQEYRTLFENMPIGLYRTSANGRILDANPAMVEMFGYKDREAILATNVAELYVDPASDEKFKSEIGKTGIISNFEAEFRRPDGSTFWTEDHNRVIWSESGSPRYYEGSLIDITERKQVEAERQALVEIMQAATLTDSLHEFLERVRGSLAKVLDAENLFVVFYNKVTGLFEEIFSVDQYDDPMPPSRLEKSISSYVFRTGEPLLLTPGRFEELREAGEVELVGAPQASWLGAPLETLNGAIGVIAVQNYEDPDCYSERDRDFLASVAGEVALAIERKRDEETLAEERNLLRTLIDNLPDRVYVEDTQGRKTLANLADWQASRVKTMEEVIGKNDFDLYPPALAEEYWAIDKAILDSGTPVINFEEPGLDAYGNLVWLLTTKVPLRDGHGKITGLVGIGHDVTQRKEAEKRIQNQLNHLAALRAIDQVITSSFDLHYNLRWILETLAKELGVDAADILLVNTGFGSLEFSAGIGFRDKAAERASVRLDHTYAGRVVLERQLIQVHDLNEQQHDLELRSQLTGEDFVSYIGVPLMAKGSIKGVLEVFHRGRLEPDQEWIDLLNTLAGQAALAIDNGSLFESLQRSNIDLTLAYDATIEGWSRAMDLRDKETEGHTLRVTKMTMDLAVLFGIKDEDLVSIRRGALLHDIGKMGVPDAILLKPAALTDEEWVIMRKHPALAYEMLAPISYLRSAIDIPYCHHEKWDGTGYPRGLKGDQIPLSARIFAIVDVWDALISDRPYRKAWSNEKILEHLKSESGTHFDPQVVKICLETGVFERK